MKSRPPKRPPPRPLQRPAMLGAGSAAAKPGRTAAAPSAVADTGDLMQQFDAALRELQDDPSLDQDTRQQLRQQFAQAMSDLGSVEGTAAGIPDRAVWMDAVHALQASGEVSEDEVNDLIRQINQALQPLERRESQLAIEFSRRLQTDGEEKALAWFRKESREGAQAPVSASDAVGVVPSDKPRRLRAEVVNSRSNRLRGPP